MTQHRPGLSALSVALLAVAPFRADAVRVDYILEAGVERDDNVLISSEVRQSETAGRAGIGFLVSEDTSTVQAHVDGRVEYWNYTEGVQSDTVEGTLAGRLNWFLVPERFSFTVEDQLEVRPIDRFSPNTSDNRQWVNTLSLGPNLHFNWTQTLRGQFELRWIDSSSEIGDTYESQRIAAAMHVVKHLDQTSSLAFTAQAMDVDFDNDLVARDYRRHDVYSRYQKQLARLGFGLDAGYSWVDFDRGADASFPLVRADLSWRATERSSLLLTAAHQLSDAATAAIAGIETATAVPGGLVVGGSAVEASVYEEDSVSLAYAYEGDRTSFMVGPYFEKTEYLDDIAVDETTRGVRAELSRRLGPTWEVAFHGDLARSRYPELDRRLEDRRYGAALTKRWNRRWSSSLRYLRYEREDSAVTWRSSQNVWYLAVTYRNR